MVSLGCPKALVDSERILTRLRAEGYAISPDYAGADAVIVNTCGFLDSAKAESLEAIGDALTQNGRVIVTGCLGAEPDYITGAHPKVLAVTGPQQYEQVLDAVHVAVPPAPDPFIDLLPPAGVKLTPRHYSYLKISEGCDHKCKFCIIPSMRGGAEFAPCRRRDARGGASGGLGREGNPRDLAGHVGLWNGLEGAHTEVSNSRPIHKAIHPRMLGSLALCLPLPRMCVS